MATQFEAPRLTTSGVGRITRSAAEASALAEARDAGRAEARAELQATLVAHDSARAGMERASLALAGALDQIEHIDLGTLHDFEQQILTLAVSIAEEIVGREVDRGDDVILGSVRRALSMTPDRGAVVLRVNTADFAAVLESAALMGHRGGEVQVVADGGVSPGGCIAEVGALRVDAQLESAFERMREAFRP
ncbi:MAG: FliH/SctL family protein [Ilumatobacteraceae bacterium]